MEERRGRAAGSRRRIRPEGFGRLQVSVSDDAGYAVVTVAGEVDVTTASYLRDPLDDLVARGVVEHVVDLRAVTFLDSTGLGILVADHKAVCARGGSLQIIYAPGFVARVFRLTGVDRVVPVRDTVEAAVATLPRSNSA
jgi:anti-sigma B factor antagonist